MEDLKDYNLHENKKLTTLTFENEEDWLELRTQGIGGSDIGAILGINKYASPLSIYKQKVEGYRKDMSNNVNVKKGKDLEDLILTKYVQPYFSKLGYNVGKPEFMMINSDFPFFRANVDGIAYNPTKNYTDNIIVEIKWVSSFAEDSWHGTDYCGVPPSYYAQVQLYMAVTGAQSAVICALFDKSWEMNYFAIPRDNVFIANMIKTGQDFYQQHMLLKIPPRCNYELDKEDVIEKSKSIPKPLVPDDKMSTYVEKYLTNSKKLKQAEQIQNELKDIILDYTLKGYCPSDSKYKIKLTTVTSSKFNSSKFKEANPDLYNEYCEESESSRFTIK